MNRPEQEGPNEPRALLHLDHIAGFEFTDKNGQTHFISPSDLAGDEEDMKRVHPRGLAFELSPDEQDNLAGEEFILRNVVLRSLPLLIVGDRELDLPPVTFKVDFERHQATPAEVYHIDEDDARVLYPPKLNQEGISTYSVRFTPKEGVVKNVGYRRLPNLSAYGLEAMETGPQLTRMSLHHQFYVEIYHTAPIGEPPPLIKPHEF